MCRFLCYRRPDGVGTAASIFQSLGSWSSHAPVRGAACCDFRPNAEQERKVKAQKEACDSLIVWLGKHWAVLLGVFLLFALPVGFSAAGFVAQALRLLFVAER